MKTTKYKLINIGRGKITREVAVANHLQLMTEVKRHLLSNDVELVLRDGPAGVYDVIVGLGRNCGTVQRVA